MNPNHPVANPSRSVRNRALLGTAVALALGAALIGETVVFTRTPALAEAVRVEGVQPVSFADVVEKVRPAVVSVRVKESAAADVSADDGNMPFDLPEGSPMEKFFKQFRQGPHGPQQHSQRPAMALGSGFFISDDGYVVTNNHVVDKAQSMTVILDDATELNTKVIGTDEKTDLALLKVDATASLPTSSSPMARRASATGLSLSAIPSASAAP